MLLETYDTNTIALWGEPERRRRLVRLCATISGDANAAEDLAQETLLEAWRNAHKLHDPSGADRWLAAIARNHATDHLRRRGPEIVELSENVAARSDESQARVVLDAVRSLPEAYRETLILRLVEGMTGPEIAVRTGLTEGSVRVNLHRGMKLLRARLGGGLAQ